MSRFALVFATALALGCSRPSRTPPAQRPAAPTQSAPTAVERDLSSNVAAALAGVLQRAGTPAVVNGEVVQVGGHAIHAHASVSQVISEMDHTTAAIDVALEVDGSMVDAFHMLALAMDADRNEAVQRAVREWSVAYGMPIADALRGAIPDGGVSAILTLGPFSVYPGPTGVRGDAPTNWDRGTPAMHRTLLDLIAPTIDSLIPPARRAGYHSIKLTMHVRNASAGEGECLVDGAPNDRLCDLVRTYPWPEGPEEYLFKQFYVLAPRSP